MKKIMFNDKYGLTQAVLDGRKTQTRRIACQEPFKRYQRSGFCTEGKDKCKLFINDGNEIVAKSHYKIGEIVAVAQRYKDIATAPLINKLKYIDHPGWGNKMFVKAEMMPHKIKITNIRVEHLHNISKEDCIKEGIFCSHHEGFKDAFAFDATDRSEVEKWWIPSPIIAFSILIDILYGISTWMQNPLVFVYDFELVK